VGVLDEEKFKKRFKPPTEISDCEFKSLNQAIINCSKSVTPGVVFLFLGQAYQVAFS
jgi:hypothetical protein